VLNEADVKGYLLTNFRGSTEKNNFVPTCKLVDHKNLHISVIDYI